MKYILRKKIDKVLKKREEDYNGWILFMKIDVKFLIVF